jgi:hypothetical protein
MPSTYTNQNGVELMATGEKSGTWGGLTNTNLEILERAISGVGAIDLTSAGASYTLTTTDATLSEGQYGVLVFDNQTQACTVTISPNDQTKKYIVQNNGGFNVILTQGSGGNVTIPATSSAVAYADGGGATAEVVEITTGFLTADRTKLDGIETAADVTDATNVGSSIWGATAKATPIDADTFAINDTAASNVLKKTTFAQLKTAMPFYESGDSPSFAAVDLDNLQIPTPTNLDISTGSITPTQLSHTVGAEASAAEDELDTIVAGSAGDLLFLSPQSSSEDIVVRDKAITGTGNILCGPSIHLANVADQLLLRCDGTNWWVVSHKTNSHEPHISTIATGVLDEPAGDYVRIATEGAAATDDLDTITAPSIYNGKSVTFRANDNGDTVVFKHQTGNIDLGGRDISLTNSADTITLVYDNSIGDWLLVSYSVSTANSMGLVQHEFSMSDDTAVNIDANKTGGFMLLQNGTGTPSASRSAIIFFDVGSTPQGVLASDTVTMGGNITILTDNTTLTGTTGTDTEFTISFKQDGTIDFENRVGSVMSFIASII